MQIPFKETLSLDWLRDRLIIRPSLYESHVFTATHLNRIYRQHFSQIIILVGTAVHSKYKLAI
jgi:hypothetical protein